MVYMLDTNMCIYLIKRKPLQVVEKFRSLSVHDIGISSITLAELEYGIAKSAKQEQNRDALAHFLAPLEISSFGDEAASCYGAIRASLERDGRPIGSMDMLIAAHALSLSAILVTNNMREFDRIPGLMLENWTEP